MKELQRAATINQSQKDVELIVQRHLQDVRDLMHNAIIHVRSHQKKICEIFWREILTKKPPVREVPKYPASDLSIDETPVIQPNEVYRVSQGGINTKVEVDIIVLSDVADFNFLDIAQLRDLLLKD